MKGRRYPPFSAFPVALWSAAFVLDVLSLVMGGEPFVRSAFLNSAMACVVALFAAVTGRAGWNRMPRAHPLARLGLAHALTSLSALAFFWVALWLRSKAINVERVPTAALVVSATGLFLLGGADVLGRMIERALSAGPGAVVVPFPRDRTARPA